MTDETIFEAALAHQTDGERSAYLDEVCAGDREQRRRIEALVLASDAAGDFLNRPAVEQIVAGADPSNTDAGPANSTPPASDTQAPWHGSGSEAPSLAFLDPPQSPGHLGRLGHYEVTELIGHGGMGIVLKAIDEKLQRVVAIKVLAPPLAISATARKRFVREAQAAAAVRNEHVINIHAVEESNGLPYLVMEYVSGLSLQQRLDQSGPLALPEILRIGVQTAAGLAAAHTQGLIHRDIKPANILLENGVERVKITDFGLARAVDDASLTQSGVVAGTPQYMSPEQAAAEGVDHRADLFSLGSVLYAMCTGQAPFRASGTMAVLKRVCEDSPRSIHETNPEIPDWLIQIIARLHAKDPADRFQSAAEVADLLGQHLAHVQQPGLAPRPAPLRSLTHPAHRRRWPFVAATVLLLVGTLGVTEATGVTRLTATVIRVLTPDGTLVIEVDDPDVRVTVEGDGGLVITGAGPHEVRLRPGSYKVRADKDGKPIQSELVTLTRGDKRVVKISLESTGRAAPAFAFTPPPPGPLDQLDRANIPAHERFPWQPKELVAVLGEHRGRMWCSPSSVTISRDGSLAASCGNDGHVYVWDPATLRLRALLAGHAGAVRSLTFSPDGDRLISGGDDKSVRLWDVATGRELHRLVGHTAAVGSVAYSPESDRALSGSLDQTMRLWDLKTGRELHCFKGYSGATNSVAFGADGSRAVFAKDDKIARVWDLKVDKEIQRLVGHDGHFIVAMMPDGVRALSASLDRSVHLWDLRTGQSLRRFDGHLGPVTCIAVSRDGRRAVSGDQHGTLSLWNVDTGERLRSIACGSSISGVALSPDGGRALSATWDGAIRLWDLESGNELLPQVGVGPLNYQPARHWFPSRVVFSLDGRHVLAGMQSPIVRLWNGESGKPLEGLETSGPIWSVAISPDGRHTLGAGRDGIVQWDIESRKELRRFEGAKDVAEIALSRDGNRLVSAGLGGVIRCWDAKNGKELCHIEGQPAVVFSVAISPDGRRALSGNNDGTVRMFDLDDGSELYCLRGVAAPVHSVGFSPDGVHAASGDSNSRVRLWDLSGPVPKSRTLPKRQTDRFAIHSLAFAADGKSLAAASHDGQLVIWEIANGNKVREWQMPGPVHGVAFTPDGRHLATANVNGTVYIIRLAKP